MNSLFYTIVQTKILCFLTKNNEILIILLKVITLLKLKLKLNKIKIKYANKLKKNMPTNIIILFNYYNILYIVQNPHFADKYHEYVILQLVY